MMRGIRSLINLINAQFSLLAQLAFCFWLAATDCFFKPTTYSSPLLRPLPIPLPIPIPIAIIVNQYDE